MSTHLKIAVVGLSQTGKSSLVARFLSKDFAASNYVPTETCLFEDVVSTIVDGTVLSATIMDTPGREDDINSLPKWFNWSDAIIVVYSINLKHSFEVVKKYCQSLHTLGQESTKQFPTPVFLVGAKEDLDRTFKRLVSVEAGAQLASQFGIPFYETSARTDVGVKNLWNKVVSATLTAHTTLDEIMKKMSTVLSNFKVISGGQALATSGRYLVKDALLTRFLPFENRKKESYVALFNDYLCVCKPKYGNSGTIICRNAIPLSSAIILEGPSNPKKNSFFFRVHHMVKAKTYDFLVHSLQEKNEWIDILEELVNTQKGLGTQITTTSLIEEYSLKNLNRLAKRSDRVFGVGLADAVHKQSFKTHSELQMDPYLISQGFEYLRKEEALKTRGIFQLASLDRAQVRQLRTQCNSGADPIFEGQPYDVVADLLVLFFNQLPLSVIPREFTEPLIQFYDLPDGTKRIEQLCTLLNACPPANFAVLVDVLVYLGYATEQSVYNGLTLERAGLVFSRLLMHLDTKQYRKCSSIISLMIENVDKLMETHNSTSSIGGGNDIVTTGKLSPSGNGFVNTSQSSSTASTSAIAPVSTITYHGGSTFTPVPKFLFAINLERQLTCINKCKYKILEIIKVLHSKVGGKDFESALQSMLINLNTIAAYEPTFVRHFMDITHFNSFYLRLLELNRLLLATKQKSSTKSKTSKLFASSQAAVEAERIKSSLWSSLEASFTALDRSCNWSREVRIAYFKIRKELERAQQLKQALGIQRDTELDSTMLALHPMYAEASVRDFWDRNFGLEKFIVKVDLFIDCLLRLNDSSLTDTERQVVRHILDHHQTGQVNIYRFAIFVSGYGPIENCLANVIKMSSEKWFYGFVSYPESIRLLEANPPGTFLVRFSQSNPGHFSVDYLASVAMPVGIGSPARSDMVSTELRTVKIHNAPGGFEVVRADLGVSAASSGSSSTSSSAPGSAPNSAPSSGKVGEGSNPGSQASSPANVGIAIPQSTKVHNAQGSFRMRTMTLLQAPERRGVIPPHLQRPTPTHSPPGSVGSSGLSTPPMHTPPGSFTNTPPSSVGPMTNSAKVAGILSGSIGPSNVTTEISAASSLTFGSIEAILEHLKDILIRPVQPNYFLIPHFHGCIDKAAAISRLTSHPPGSFLSRFGDAEDSIAVHVVSASPSTATKDVDLSSFQSEPKIESFVLERVLASSQVKHLGVTYTSLEAFIKQCKTPMTTPLLAEQEKLEEPAIIEDGTLEKIVEKLYDGSHLGVAQVFLLTYRAFATPAAVLNILRERIHYHREHNQDRTFRLRMGNFVKTWITEYSWDIKDEKDFHKLCSKLAHDLAQDPSTSAIGQQLSILIQKQQESNAPTQPSSSAPNSPMPMIPLSRILRVDRLMLSQSSSQSNIAGSGSSTLETSTSHDDEGFGERYDEDDEAGSSPGSSSSNSGGVLSNSSPGNSSPVQTSASTAPIPPMLGTISGPRRADSGPLLYSPKDKDSARVSISLSSGSVLPPTGGSLRGAITMRGPPQDQGTFVRSVLEIPVTELAEQLTLIEAEVFQSIPLHEFLQQGWLKSDKETRSPHLLRMVRLSTRLSRWVVAEILSDDKPVKRAKVIEYFVQVCHELLKLNNFNGIMAVLAALSGSAIGRLKKTWDAFSKARKKELDELHTIMDTDSNWSKYRTALMKAPPPKIPYLGLVLTDLVFIEDGNQDRLPSGHINWVKCELLAECLHQVQLSQQSQYRIAPNDTLVDGYVLEVAKTMTEREAYDRSLVVEPRKANKK